MTTSAAFCGVSRWSVTGSRTGSLVMRGSLASDRSPWRPGNPQSFLLRAGGPGGRLVYAGRPQTNGGPGMLLGRQAESVALDRLLRSARGGNGGALVVQGEPGIGKSALLDNAIAAATGFRVLRTVGSEAEMEVPFAALHQLCAPVLAGLEQLAAPQRDALGVAFALTAGAAPDRLVVGLAMLNLLSQLAGERPVLCVVGVGQGLYR